MAYIQERNGKYKATIRIDGKRIAKSFDTRVEAEAWANARKAPRMPMEQHELHVPYNLHEILHRYMQEVTPTHKAWKNETQMIKQILRDYAWVSLPLSALRVSHITEWRDKRLLTVAPSTVSRHLDVIKSACKHAESEWDYYTPLAALRKIKVKKEQQAEKFRRIPQDTLDTLIWSAEQGDTSAVWMPDVIQIALLTAMRRSEITALKRSEVDMERNYLRVVDAKNGRDRVVPLFDKTKAILQKHMDMRHDDDKVFGISTNMLYMAWKRCVKRAGVTDVRFHDLRHEAASRFFDAGLSPIEVAKMTGHRTMSQLMRYSHADTDSIISKMNEVLS